MRWVGFSAKDKTPDRRTQSGPAVAQEKIRRLDRLLFATGGCLFSTPFCHLAANLAALVGCDVDINVQLAGHHFNNCVQPHRPAQHPGRYSAAPAHDSER